MAREFKQDVDMGEYKVVARTRRTKSLNKNMTEIRWAGCQQEKPAPTGGLGKNPTAKWDTRFPRKQVKETSGTAWGSKTHF